MVKQRDHSSRADHGYNSADSDSHRSSCTKLAPVLGDIEDDYEESVSVYKVNTNFDAELAEKYEVTANPTLLFIKDGQVVERTVGVQKLADLKAIVEKLVVFCKVS